MIFEIGWNPRNFATICNLLFSTWVLKKNRLDLRNAFHWNFISFQNSLSHLTTNMIQQFLDELTFRESFGLYPLLCFESIIQRLATQV